jgi:hypothetical protein
MYRPARWTPWPRKVLNCFPRASAFFKYIAVARIGFSANDLKELIQKVLQQPDFDAADVDLHDRLMNAVKKGTIDVLDFWKDRLWDGE